MQTWEYIHAFGELDDSTGITLPVVQVVNGSELGTDERKPVHVWLEAMGAAGWELIAVVGENQYRGFYLKRPKPGS
jgi:hypothetical protein